MPISPRLYLNVTLITLSINLLAADHSIKMPTLKIFDPKQPAVAIELDQIDDELMACVRKDSGWRRSNRECVGKHESRFYKRVIFEPKPYVTVPNKLYSSDDYVYCRREWVTNRYCFDPKDELHRVINAYSRCIVPKAYGSAHVDRSELDDCRAELTRRVNQELAKKYQKEMAAATAAVSRLAQAKAAQLAVGPAQLVSSATSTGNQSTLSAPTIAEQVKDSWFW